MRIGVFTDTFKPVTNGVVDAVWRLCKGLKDAGHEVHLFALSDRNKEEIEEGVFIHKFKGRQFNFYPDLLIRYTLPLNRVKKLMEKYKIEIIHNHVHMAMGLTAMRMSKKFKIPIINTYHTLVPEFISCFLDSWDKTGEDMPVFIKILKKLKLEKPILWYAKKMVWAWMRFFNLGEWLTTPSEYTKKILVKNGMTDSRIKIVPNPISLGKKKRVKKVNNLILHVGRLSPEKRVDILIKSLALMKHDFKAVITSDGPQMVYLKNLAKKLGINKKVEFTGFISRERLEQYYDEAELFVSAAEYDTFNNCMAEAVAHELPVIINKNSGATDFVKNGKNGLVLDSNEPEVFAEKMDYLLSNKKARGKLKKSGKEIMDYTDINNIIEKLMKLYKTPNKNQNRWKRFKDTLVYGYAMISVYSILGLANIFERD